VTVDLSDDAVSVLAEGRQVYVAVASDNGPHVTPELYAWSRDRLWFAAATSTLKAKVLTRDRVAGAAVMAGGRAVVMHGDVEVFDPRDPASLLTRFTQLPDVVRALGGFTIRNAHDLMAFAGDAVTGKLGARLPPARMLFALTPSRVGVVGNDAVPAGGQAAFVAVPGPVPLPARWFADERRAFVAPALLDAVGAGDEFPAGIVVDEYGAPGPAAKQGTLVRGTARRDGERPGWLDVDVERVTEWDGVATSTTRRRASS
jgi:hypothetical protein